MNKNYNALSGSRDTRLKKEHPGNYFAGCSKVKWLLSVFTLICVLTGFKSSAQVTVTGDTNTTPAMATSYPTLALAIADVNSRTAISGPVTLTLTGPETAPAGGYVLNNTVSITGGSNTNRFIFDGGGNTITASNALTVGVLNDAIFKIIGSDFLTIQNFVMTENAANTVASPAGSNNMTEFGVALLYESVTNGAQNNIIQGNTITLVRTYTNTFGIYSNTRHSSTSISTGGDATSAAGTNSNNRFYSNTISNVNMGITLIGSAANTVHDQGNDIGGIASGTGNIISNWGGAGAVSSYLSNSGTSYCIFVNHQDGENVSYNTITSAAVSGTAVTFVGIRKDYTTTAPVGTFTSNITNNTITMTSGFTSGTFQCVLSQGMGTLATATININNNTLLNCAVTGTASTSTIVGFVNSSAPGVLNMNNNIIRGTTSTATSGGFTGISNTGAVTSALSINGNQIGNASGNAVTFSVANSGTITGISAGTPAAAASLSISNNDFRGIVNSVAGTGSHTYIAWTHSTGTGVTDNLNGNTFTNLNVNSSGSVTFFSRSTSGNMAATSIMNVNNNAIVTGFAKPVAAGTVTIYTNGAGSSSVSGSTQNETFNNFSNITLTGSTIFLGWINADGTTTAGNGPTKNISNNTFSNIITGSGNITALSFTFSANGTNVSSNTISNLTTGGAGQIVGINSGSTNAGTHTISNNSLTGFTGQALINAMQVAPNAACTTNIFGNTISGISTSGGANQALGMLCSAGTNNIYKNRIGNLTSNFAGASFVIGIAVQTAGTYNISNNIIGDLKAPASTSLTAVTGISAGAAVTVNAYYNTVYLNATSSSVTTFGTSCMSFNATTTAFNSRNNILYNTSVPAQEGLNIATNGISAGLRRSGGTAATVPTNYAVTSDNNAYWVNPGAGTNNHSTYVEGTTTITNSQNTVANMKTFMATRDQLSIQEPANFLSTAVASPDFLKIDPAIASTIESGAVNIATFTDDFEGTIRQGNPGYLTQVNGGGTAPDIGADEYDGAPSLQCTGTPAASTINGAASVCPGTGTTLSLSTVYNGLGYTYQWFSGTTPGGPYPTAMGTGTTQGTGNLASDTYFIAVITCSNGGAFYTTAEKAVTVGALPAGVTASGSGTFCTSALITASNGGDGTIYFQGTTAGGTSTATASSSQTVTASGTYYFRAQSALGCWGPEGSVAVVIDQPAGITGTPASICQGESGTIAASSAVNCLSYVASGTSLSGAWTAGSPSANRPATSDNSATCSFSAATPRNYDTKSFQVNVAGTYSFKMTFNTNYDGMGYLVSGAFVPGSCATGTFIKGDDDENGTTDNEPLFTANLVPGVTYTLVSTNWDIVTLVDTYVWTITPPSGGQFMLPVNGTIEWYTAASGGSSIGSGSPFNPVGVAGSGLADTNTPGTTTYYAACSSSASCRTAVDFVINPSSTNPTTTITSCGPYTWSVNGTTYNTSGSYTSVTNCVTDNLVLTVNPVVAQNTNTSTNYCSIQAAIDDVATLNGHTIAIAPGTHNEKVLVNKSVTLTAASTQPTIDFTGTVTGRPAMFDVTADNVTINNIRFNVDMSKFRSAILVSAPGIDNITVTNNLIDTYGTPAGSYGDRNAVSVNYGGPTNYRVATGGVNSITFSGNTVNGSGPGSYFRAAIATDESGGTFSGNTLQSINHDVLSRFGGNGNITITGNNLNGGGVEVVEMNAGAGVITIAGNNFDGAFANVAAANSAVLRLQNNQSMKQTNVIGNIFTNHQWAVMLANYNSVTLNGNTFTPLAGSTTYHHVAVLTKGMSSNSGSLVQTTVDAIMTNNTFNGSGTMGGTAVSFHNHDSDAASFGAFTLGTPGNENNFNAMIANAVYLDHQTGTSSGSTFPAYSSLIGVGAGALTTMAMWTPNIDATNNRFDVGAGLELPSAMSSASLFTLEDRVQHSIDATGLGLVTVKANNAYVTTNSFIAPLSTTPAIARGIAAASTGHTVNVSPGTFVEDVVVNKQLTVLGSGMGVTTVSGPAGGGGSTFMIAASNPVIEGFTITREGNTVATWNDPTLNTAGVSVQGQTVSGEVRYCEINGMRTAIDINNSNGNNIHNNYIHFNRTGVILRNQTDNTVFENNIVTDNWTAGILFLDASGGTNTPVQSAANSSFNDNNISGNWYAQVVDRQAGGSLPAPGSNLKNFTCNWYGSTSPVVTTANSAEPGYAAQIPLSYGGTATAPGGQPDIAGPASANIVYAPLAVSGADLDGLPSTGWQPSAPCAAPCDLVVTATPTAIVCNGGTSTVTVTATGGSGNYTSGIGTFTVTAGTYTYTVTDLNGCVDSETITISEPAVSAGTTTITACDSYTWAGPLGNGTTYTVSGTYTNVTTNGSGCQHTETLVLTINNSTTNGSMTVTNAGPYTWAGPLGSGLTYNTSGVYTHVTTNGAGCPNTATLTLTVTPVNSFVIGTSCGATISAMTVTVIAPVVSGASTYTFQLTNTVTSAVVLTVNRPVNSLALSNYAGITLGTQYSIRVSTNGGATYGPPCIIITPSPTSTIGAQCGTTLTSMSQFVYATYAPTVTGYRFRVTNTATSAVQVYDALSGQNRFSFSQLPAAFAQFSTIYSVEVALRNTDGTYLPYGAACNITTPAFPTSEVVLSQCDYTATSYTQMINAVGVSGATGYRFQLVNSTLSYNFSIDRSLASFNLSMFPGIVDGVTYTVRVAVRIGGVWGPLNGKPCNLTAPGTLPDNWDGNDGAGDIIRAIEANNMFSAIAYPNPFAENFKFDVQTTAQGSIQVRVYDMLGKQVENKNVEVSDINNLQFGDAYPSGVYNVVVSQGDNTRTVRVIKR